MNIRLLTLSTVICTGFGFVSADDALLSGTPFGSQSVDYSTGMPTTSVNTPSEAFDGDLSTCFASYDRSRTYVGLDLGEPHVITRVGWSPRNDFYGPGRVVLGVFQGANSPDFMDAVPLYIITEAGVIGTMHHADVDCSRGFRYVRYVGPADARCNIAELEFYGHPGAGDDSHLYQFTNIPTVVINTKDAQEPFDKETNIDSNIIILNDNTVDVEAIATTRERGNASRQFPKKPWRIKFDKKQNVLGSPAKAKKWCLINNYGDKTLMRNAIAFEVSRRMQMPYTPFLRLVDVVMNGEYKGTYQLTDQVELNDGRIEGKEMSDKDIDGDALTGAYHLEIDGYADQETSWFMSRRGIPVTIKSPDEDEILPVQHDYIEKAFNSMESSAFGGFFTNEKRGYRNYVDTYTWQRHMLIEEIVANPDQLWSIHLVKPRGNEHIAVASVWDFDIALDNDIRHVDTGHYPGYLWTVSTSAGTVRDLYYRFFIDDPSGVEEVKALWTKAREEYGITPESIQEYIDSVADNIRESQRVNFMRWPILDQMVHNNWQALGSWEAEVNYVRDFIEARINTLDKVIGYDPSSVSEITVATGGKVRVVNGSIVTEGFAQGTRYSVYDLSGMTVAEGECGIISAKLAPGLYIVKAGNTNIKISVK